MHKLVYILKVSLKRVIHNWGFNIILLLSFYIGLMLPAFCAASTSYYMNAMKRFQFEDYGNTIYFSYMDVLSDDTQLFGIKEAAEGKAIEIFARNWDIVPEFYNANVTVYGVGGEYDKFEDVSLVEGRKFTKDDIQDKRPLCLAAQDLLIKYKCSVGDSITIQNETFQIIGSIRDSAYTGYALIPYGNMRDIYKDTVLQQTVSISTNDPVKAIAGVEQYMYDHFPDIEIVQLMKYEELTASFKNMIRGLIQVRVLVGMGAYLFSVLNIIMLMSGKAYEARKRYAIQEIEGMSFKELFLEFMCENVFLAVLANVILAFTIMPAGRILGLDNEMIYDYRTAGVMLLFSAGLCLILSIVLMYRFRRQPAADILRQET